MYLFKKHIKTIILISSLFFAGSVYGTNFNITPTSGGNCVNNPNDCTLQEAFDIAQDNGEADTITLAPGTYKTSDNNNKSFEYIATNTETFDLTIIGSGTDSILDAEQETVCIRIEGVANNTGSTFTVKDLTFSNTGGKNMPDTAALTIIAYSAQSIVTGNQFIANRNSVIIRSNDSDVEFTNNTVQGSYGFFGTRFNLDVDFDKVAGNILVEKNVFAYNSEALVIFGVQEAIVRNNLLFNNFNEQSDRSGAITIGTEGKVSVVHNTIYGNTTVGYGGGLLFFLSNEQEQESDIQISNNIIADNQSTKGGQDIHLFDDEDGDEIGSLVTLTNNVFSKLLSACQINNLCTPDIVIEKQLDIDPDFVNPLLNNFELQNTSLLIGAADPNAPDAPTDDLYGRTRKEQPDIGAIENLGEVNVFPSAIQFDDVLVGNSSSETLFISNESNGTIEISTLELSGSAALTLDPNAGDAACGAAPFTLEEGEICTVAVVFSPTSTGEANAEISIDTANANFPSFTVPVSGTGYVIPEAQPEQPDEPQNLKGDGCSLNASTSQSSGLFLVVFFFLGALSMGLRKRIAAQK